MGMYFVTICTKDFIPWFGKVASGNKVDLSTIGKIVLKEWYKTGEKRKNVELDFFVIMPNHIHAVVGLTGSQNVETRCRADLSALRVSETPRSGVPAPQGVSTGKLPTRTEKASETWKADTLGAIINNFKGACTKQIKNTNPTFSWQPRFYEHVIRNETDLFNVRNYIKYNPLSWENDRNNPKNIAKSVKKVPTIGIDHWDMTLNSHKIY